jgi:hypothetical protein
LLSGLYGEEELHALRLAEHTASEILRQTDEQALRRQVSKRTLWFVFEPGGRFEPVTLECVSDRLRSFYEVATSREDIEQFEDVNRASLQTLWEWAPGEALALKHISEAKRKALGGRKAPASQQSRDGIGDVPADQGPLNGGTS